MISNVALRAMQAASDKLEFETAALWRDRIRALTAIQANQDVNLQGLVVAILSLYIGQMG